MDCIGVGQDRYMGSLVGKRTLTRPWRKWDDIIEMDFLEVVCGLLYCIGVCLDREIGNLGGKRPLSRPRRKWDDLLKLIFRK